MSLLKINMKINYDLHKLAIQLGEQLSSKMLRCSVAESCTGGSLSAAITDIPGSSSWFDRGIITYTNESKHQLLSVPLEILENYGAVSKETVFAMAKGILEISNANISVAVSGIAGPTGGSVEKPVGTVWISWVGDCFEPIAQQFIFSGNRLEIRQQAVIESIKGILNKLI